MCRLLHEAGRPELAAQASGCDEVGIGQLLRDGQAPTWPKDTPNVPECLRAVRDFTEHRDKQDMVEGAGRKRQVLCAGLNTLSALKTCGAEPATRLQQHFPLDGQTDQPPSGTDATGDVSRVIPGAGSDLEDPLARLKLKCGEDTLRTDETLTQWRI